MSIESNITNKTKQDRRKQKKKFLLQPEILSFIKKKKNIRIVCLFIYPPVSISGLLISLQTRIRDAHMKFNPFCKNIVLYICIVIYNDYLWFLGTMYVCVSIYIYIVHVVRGAALHVIYYHIIFNLLYITHIQAPYATLKNEMRELGRRLKKKKT